MKGHVFVSVVIYLSNERDSASRMIPALDRFLSDHFDLAEILVVDDASVDGSLNAVKALASSTRHPLTVIELIRSSGVDTAMLAGLQQAMGDFVFEFETCRPDFAWDVLLRMYEESAAGSDIVAASADRIRTRSRLFYAVINRYGNLGTPLSTDRVRVVSRRALNAMLALDETVRYRKALYAITGYPQTRLSYPSISTSSSPGPADDRSLAEAVNIIISYSNFGPRAGLSLALLFGVVSLCAALYAALVFIFYRNVISGWTTVMMLLSLGFCGVFLVLGLIGSYVSNILVEMRKRPPFAVRHTTVYNPLSCDWYSESPSVADLAVGPYLRSQVGEAEPYRG